jgi:NADPH-ferrihemoprotein reductase
MDFKGVIYICGSQQMGTDILNVVSEMFKKVQKVAPYMAFKKVKDLEKSK